MWRRVKEGDITITKIRECFLLQTANETSMILAVCESVGAMSVWWWFGLRQKSSDLWGILGADYLFYRAQIEKAEFKQQHQLMSPRFSLDPIAKRMEEDDLVICRGGKRVVGNEKKNPFNPSCRSDWKATCRFRVPGLIGLNACIAAGSRHKLVPAPARWWAASCCCQKKKKSSSC